MIKLLTINIDNVLLKEKNVDLSESELVIKKLIDNNYRDDNYMLEARKYFLKDSIIMDLTKAVIDKVYTVTEPGIITNLKKEYPNIKMVLTTNYISFFRDFIGDNIDIACVDDLLISNEIHKSLTDNDYYQLILERYQLSKDELLIVDDNANLTGFNIIKPVDSLKKTIESTIDNMNNISLRRLKDDESDYQLLTKWCSQKEIYDRFEQRLLTYDEIKAKYYPRTLNDTKVVVYMIEYNGKPVGIIQYQLREENIYDLDIYIGELLEQNKGIGSRAISILCDMLYQTKEVNNIIMCPLKDNLQAIKCYEKAGFKTVKSYFANDTIGELKEFVYMVKK